MSGEILEREILEQPARLESFLKDEGSAVGEIACSARTIGSPWRLPHPRSLHFTGNLHRWRARW